jgi:hypothetical protein
MKATTAVIAFAFALLGNSVFAAPFTPEARTNTVTLQLSNDQSGHYADVPIPADGVQRTIESLYAGTPVASGTQILVTSAQLVQFQQDTTCVISQNPTLRVTLNAEKTWVSLEQGAVIDLESGYVVCQDS